MTKRKRESGMALITVLLIISTMSLFAMIIIDSIKFASRTSINFANNHQMRMFADSAETLVNHNLEKFVYDTKNLDARLNQMANGQFVFEIPDGTISLKISDGSNCFNINSIVKIEDSIGLVGDEENAKLFENLLIALGIESDRALAITAEAIDWIDTDEQVEFMGAEDDYYITLDNPYRTGRTIMYDVSELRALRSMTPEIYGQVRPFLCAADRLELRKINVNTLPIEKSPLMAAYIGDSITISEVMSIFTFSKNSNFTSVDAYFRAHNIDPDDLETNVKERFSTSTRLFHVDSVIRYRESMAETWVAFEIDSYNNVTKVDWRYGSIE